MTIDVLRRRIQWGGKKGAYIAAYIVQHNTHSPTITSKRDGIENIKCTLHQLT